MDYKFKLRLERVYRTFKTDYKVKLLEEDDFHESFIVKGGTKPYTVTLQFDEDGRMYKKSCTCPDYTSKEHKLCKHIIGVLYETNRDYMLIDKLMEDLKS